MSFFAKITFSLLIFLLFVELSQAQTDPSVDYPHLFRDVQLQHIFRDQKTFVDLPPKIDPSGLDQLYLAQKDRDYFNLKDFVGTYFDAIQQDTTAMLQHIHRLWNELTRTPDQQNAFSSLLPLPQAYVVPGGRFTEIYYWDSYFTMLGLQVDGRADLIANMVDNFAYLIQSYGHIPNGNRTYYLSRSQPPFFALMVELLAEAERDESVYRVYLDAMTREYQYWMSGEKVVVLEDGSRLTRYWDELCTARPESFAHDVELMQRADRDSSLYRDLRSAAESGWDFSSRWFADGEGMERIQTTAYIPVDLNSLLYRYELILARANSAAGHHDEAAKYERAAQARKKVLLHYCWNRELNFFADYNFRTQKPSSHLTLAGVFPLFIGIASPSQAEQVVQHLQANFLKQGGWITTLVDDSGQQWDSPNGWAPLQWVTFVGLRNYGQNELARDAAQRWINLNAKVYFETGKMKEKYDVVNPDRPGGGGEYDGQDGFGWTNGVFLKLWDELQNRPIGN